MAQENMPSTLSEDSENIPFYKIWLKAVTKPSVETYQEIIADPHASTSTAYIWLALVMLFGTTVSTLLSLIIQKLFGGTTVPFYSQFEQYGVDVPIPAMTGITSFICGIPLAVLFGLVGVTILVGIMHGIARMLGGTGDFDKLLYAVAAFYCPIYVVNSFISPIPGLNCLVFLVLIYVLVLNVMAVKANYNLDWVKAAVAALGVYILLFILVVCCIAVLGIAFGSAFSEILRQMGTLTP